MIQIQIAATSGRWGDGVLAGRGTGGAEDSKVGVKRCCRQQKEAEPGVGLRGLGLGYQSKGFSTWPGRNAKEKHLMARREAWFRN